MSIECKVAQILSGEELVITAGSLAGVEEGMTFSVMGTFEIKDPDTGEKLDDIPFTKVRVKATLVRPKVSIAKTFRTIRDPDIRQLLVTPASHQERFEFVQTEGVARRDSTVHVGDLVTADALHTG